MFTRGPGEHETQNPLRDLHRGGLRGGEQDSPVTHMSLRLPKTWDPLCIISLLRRESGVISPEVWLICSVFNIKAIKHQATSASYKC